MFDCRRVGGILLLCLITGLAGCQATPGLVSIKVTPSPQLFTSAGQIAQLTAIGTFQQGKHPPTRKDITTQVTWRSSDATIAKMNASGVVTAGANLGTAVITAGMSGGFLGLITGTGSVSVCKSITPGATQCS